MQYTRNTFRQFDFSEEEIFQICECVRYFVTNQQALSVNIHIKRRTAVTQISLKNFAWNIAFQYNISRDVTAQFVIQTFHEWFVNSTIDTIRKNLRTTTGNHKIKIDEQIIKHPTISKLRRKDINKTNKGNTYFHKLRYDVNANRFYKVDVEIDLLLNYPFQSSKILVIRLNCLIPCKLKNKFIMKQADYIKQIAKFALANDNARLRDLLCSVCRIFSTK